ncbi:MAG: hypothetical protein MUC92_03710 [Fimbriimonadaceae bacterium]|jgi:succinate dehydrogenase / fumarate reductase cytochrome b subunit|nr:hypothetical protein [Fimbriimonadaceae bacterium]
MIEQRNQNMLVRLVREDYFWHKVHSLTGIVPVGYYLAQHLLLNTFSLAGASRFNGVIGFFEGMPTHFLLALKIVAIWIPLIFHAVYGIFIISRAEGNYSEKAYKYRENRYYTWQRWSGIFAFFFLCYHMFTTSVAAKIWGVEQTIAYDQWASKLAGPTIGGVDTYLILVVYMLGILVCTYHLGYGLWNFCIRWGITVSEKAQMAMAKVGFAAFVVLTLFGWVALFGFFNPIFEKKDEAKPVEARMSQPMVPTSETRQLP